MHFFKYCPFCEPKCDLHEAAECPSCHRAMIPKLSFQVEREGGENNLVFSLNFPEYCDQDDRCRIAVYSGRFRQLADWMVGQRDQNRWRGRVSIKRSIHVYLWFYGCTYYGRINCEKRENRIQVVVNNGGAQGNGVNYNPVDFIFNEAAPLANQLSDPRALGLLWREKLSVPRTRAVDARKLNLAIGTGDDQKHYFLVGGEDPIVFGRNRRADSKESPKASDVVLRLVNSDNKNRRAEQSLISRNHAVVQPHTDGFLLQDTSKEGTTINSPNYECLLKNEQRLLNGELMANMTCTVRFKSLGFYTRLFSVSLDTGAQNLGQIRQIANFFADPLAEREATMALRLERAGAENVFGAETVVVVPRCCEVGPSDADCPLWHAALEDCSRIWFIGGNFWLQSQNVVRDPRANVQYPAEWPIPLKPGARLLVDGVRLQVDAKRVQPSYKLEQQILAGN